MKHPDEVAKYLEDHPHFFRQFPDLLDQMQIDQPRHGRTASVTEHHLINLREKCQRLEAQLQQLIETASDNHRTSESMHALCIDLIAITDLSAVLMATQERLRHAFTLPFFGVRFWQLPKGVIELPPCVEINPSYQAFADGLQKPYCGATHGLDLSGWFGEEAGEQVQSQALVPLIGPEGSFGIFALGSDDGDRFTEDMGTLFLERLGQMLSVRLYPYFAAADTGE